MASVVKRPAPIPRWFWFASMLGCTPGFKRSRCKKLLKVTMSRIKLLRGRREVQVRQLRRDVAQLLQLGQEENAESRLDRLWKEQSLLSAYIRTGEYCQLVKANLSNIALPRECPMDLKEPIASLCFAASCCADLPELQDLREIMVLKYGKDFLLSAQELLPGKHVNKTFLEAFATKEQSELSRKALLKGILKEYNVGQPKTPKCPPNHDSQKIPPACEVSLKQESRDTNGQHPGLLVLEKGGKHLSARQIESGASRPYEGLNGEHALQGKKSGQHKHSRKDVHGQLEKGTTETKDMILAVSSHEKRGRRRSRPKDHKMNTVVDQVAEAEQHLSSKQKSTKKCLEPESAVIYGLRGYLEGPLPEEVEVKGGPRSKEKVISGKSRSEREVNGIVRGQHECGEALTDAYEQIQGDEKRTHGKSVESLSQGFKVNGMQQERNRDYEEQNHVERNVYSRSSGNSRSERAIYDLDKIQHEREMPHSDCNYVRTSRKGHSKNNGRLKPAGECDNMQKETSFHCTQRRMFNEEPRSGVAYEFEIEEPSQRDEGSLREHKEAQKVQRERKHFTFHETAEMEALLGAYPNAHWSQKARKKLMKKHHYADKQQEVGAVFSKLLPDQVAGWADKQQEVGTVFSELVPDQAANVSPTLHNCYKDDEYQVSEAARQRSKNFHRVKNHVTDAGAKTRTETSGNQRLHESAVERCIDERHVPDDLSMDGMQRRSRRIGEHNLDGVKSRRTRLHGNVEPMQETIVEEKVNGKASLPGHTKESSTYDSESNPRERRGHLLESERGAEVKNGYGVHQVKKSPQKEPKQLERWAKEVKQRSCELDNGSPLTSRFSKPPDRPPPPIPPYRVSSLPIRQPLNSPPVLPKRCATLETSHIRAIQEPHVHPKLPDYEDLVASFAALRNKSPHSSSSC